MNKKMKRFRFSTFNNFIARYVFNGRIINCNFAGDHQSNNTSDEYQQTFYVAETALLEGRKRIQNKMMGPLIVVDDEYAVPLRE